jgi:excisionase family DNA binding protein
MNPPIPSPSLPCITRFEFAVMLAVSVRTVDRMIAAKEIPVHRVRGKVVRILRSDAERYLGTDENTSSGLRPPSPQRGEGTTNLKTKNQTGASAPEINKTKTQK